MTRLFWRLVHLLPRAAVRRLCDLCREESVDWERLFIDGERVMVVGHPTNPPLRFTLTTPKNQTAASWDGPWVTRPTLTPPYPQTFTAGQLLTAKWIGPTEETP